jgi:hypothetical protein
MSLGPRRVVGGVGAMSAVLAMSLRFGLGCGGSDEPLILLSAGLGGAPPHAASASVGSNVSTAISTGALTWPDDGPREGPCAPKSSSLEVPYGWTEYRDWSCKCPFYVPSSKDVLPEPIQWKPCTSLPAGIDCRVMVTSWNDSHKPIALDGLNFDHNPDGSAVLGFARNTKSVGTLLIADADGPVRSAMMWTVPAKLGCYPQTDAVNEGKFLYSLHGDDLKENSSTAEGSIGGLIDDLKPPVLTRQEWKGPFIFGWTAGAKWIVRMTGDFRLYAHPWEDPSKEYFITSPGTDHDGEAASQLLVRGDGVFWNTTSLHQNGINIWTKEGGTRPFIRWVGEYTKGADALGTDGVDMVWAYGEGKRWNELVYPRRSVMTSPFTTDPKKLKPRRLRKHPYDTIGNERYVVGCGYAAHLMLDQTSVGTMVIRLSDGHAWVIPRTPEFTHYEPLGVACEDVFIKGEIEGRTTIARIRLDSLGPGLPPD